MNGNSNIEVAKDGRNSKPGNMHMKAYGKTSQINKNICKSKNAPDQGSW